MKEKILCPFCNKPYTREMLEAYDTSCGFDTCDKVGIEIVCASCKKTVYVKEEFAFSDEHEEIIKGTTEDEIQNAVDDAKLVAQ